MQVVEENFNVVCDLVNQLYDEKWDNKLECPYFSMYRMMGVIWRRTVFDPISSEIHDFILNLFQTQRKRIGNTLIISGTNAIPADNHSEYILIK